MESMVSTSDGVFNSQLNRYQSARNNTTLFGLNGVSNLISPSTKQLSAAQLQRKSEQAHRRKLVLIKQTEETKQSKSASLLTQQPCRTLNNLSV